MNIEIELYKKKLKAIETALRELKYYRKALERDICKFFIKSYSNKDLDCNYCLTPEGHKDPIQSDYQTFVYNNKKSLENAVINSTINNSEALGCITRDYIRYKSLRKSIREINKSIEVNTKLYEKLMKEYKEVKNGYKSR